MENNLDNENNNTKISTEIQKEKSYRIADMYENWFLDYASYVILERAIPHINDGLKPVQRRILHSMYELEDGRYNKVANIIGHTMKYHPHGDASIYESIVQIGQKDLLIDMQGNWGNIYTGDKAAASRYIEARLSKFALEVLFNPKLTSYHLSYDGRNEEPDTLPVKFPLLLALGVEGIAVGLNSKILPHNFNELIDASIAFLKDKPFVLYPDFQTGGLIDVTNYNDGERGGKIRVRAKIAPIDSKTLIISEIPADCTTSSLIDSILSANDKGKIKIKKIEDNTAENVEIVITLAPGISADTTIDALYAFTACEISISPNACIIKENKPIFTSVTEALKHSTLQTLELTKIELSIRINELKEKILQLSLEKIFIENRIYLLIEKCETFNQIIETIKEGLQPFLINFYREIIDEDIIRLTEIKIKRISKFDAFKSDQSISNFQNELNDTTKSLLNIIEYVIEYFKKLKIKFGKNKERKSEIRNFENIEATKVVLANEKLYVNKKDGFFGTALKNEEYVCDCSDIDDIIVFRNNGTFTVSKVSTKNYAGKEIIHINIFDKSDSKTTYNVMYFDGEDSKIRAKRFNVIGTNRDKEYWIIKEHKDSKLLYFSINNNSETEIVTIFLKYNPKLKRQKFEFDFSSIDIKGRNSQGNIITRHPIYKIALKEKTQQKETELEVWFDENTKRLNSEVRGKYLGKFNNEDKILAIMQSGSYCTYNSQSLLTHFDEDMCIIEKFNPELVITAIYLNNTEKQYFIKRFNITVSERKILFIDKDAEDLIYLITTQSEPIIQITFNNKNKNTHPDIQINAREFVEIKGVKAKGKRLSKYEIKKITII
ncbi:MAG: DNA topoisomerase IV [Bacteroidetes bacterium GWE2_29_8]|nr:MAG: DNA topoisomerase IV [Bacteroidetes bacterium GWE2_29_8]OFY13969.1 MAG: DNA topoisomerase IV [Bacteroidetes bacterium GWF2_29_10]